MDDENTLMPDPEILIVQAFRDRVEEIIHAPFKIIFSAGNALRKKSSGLKNNLLDYLISTTEYDLEHQLEQNL